MAKRFRPSSQKRNKERARQQKQQEKAARRLQAKQRRANGTSEMGETPLDMTDMGPDPQLLPELLPARGDDVRNQA